MCIYVCVWGCLDKYISVVTWPPQTKIPGSAPARIHVVQAVDLQSQLQQTWYQCHWGLKQMAPSSV